MWLINSLQKPIFLGCYIQQSGGTSLLFARLVKPNTILLLTLIFVTRHYSSSTVVSLLLPSCLNKSAGAFSLGYLTLNPNTVNIKSLRKSLCPLWYQYAAINHFFKFWAIYPFLFPWIQVLKVPFPSPSSVIVLKFLWNSRRVFPSTTWISLPANLTNIPNLKIIFHLSLTQYWWHDLHPLPRLKPKSHL